MEVVAHFFPVGKSTELDLCCWKSVQKNSATIFEVIKCCFDIKSVHLHGDDESYCGSELNKF